MTIANTGGLVTVRGAYSIGITSTPTEYEVVSVRDLPDYGSDLGSDFHVVLVKKGESYYEGTVNSNYKIQKGDKIEVTPQLGSHIPNCKKI